MKNMRTFALPKTEQRLGRKVEKEVKLSLKAKKRKVL